MQYTKQLTVDTLNFHTLYQPGRCACHAHKHPSCSDMVSLIIPGEFSGERKDCNQSRVSTVGTGVILV